MLSFLAGLIVTGAGVAGIWYCKPQDGKVRWFVLAPVLEWAIPIGLVSALALGVALLVDGVTRMAGMAV
jgi:hypothetical protein